MASYLGLRGAPLATVISGTTGLCFLCFGYAQGVLGGLLTVPAFLEEFPELDIMHNNTAQRAKIIGAVMGTWNLGCFVSAIITIFLGDYLGRKKTLMVGLVLWVIGELVQCTSYSFEQFVAGRFIAGFGNGFTTATVPAYQAESVKSHRKGTILMISAGVFIALGLAISYWVVFGMAYATDFSAAWRVPIALQIVFALVAFVFLIFLPESPRWLILTGREEEALRVLSALNDEDLEGPAIRDEFLQIKDAILVMAQGTASSLASNKEKRNAHRVMLGYLVQVFQQMSGINLALQYLALMFAVQMGFTGWVARLLGACAASEYFLSSFVAVVGIDRFWGRRSLMMFGAAGMALCMALLTILLYLYQIHGVGGTNIAAAIFLFGFSTFFAIGWQGMAWLYQVEIVPLRIRGPANALSTSGNWLFNFIVIFITPIAFHNIGWRTYIIFACTNAAIIPLVYYLYPETAYRSLEEVDMLFHLANEAPGNPWLNIVRISLEQPLWYGKKGDVPFDYEKSEWHQHYQRLHSSGTTLENSEASQPQSGVVGGIAPSGTINSTVTTSSTRPNTCETLHEMKTPFKSHDDHSPGHRVRTSPSSDDNEKHDETGDSCRTEQPTAPPTPEESPVLPTTYHVSRPRPTYGRRSTNRSNTSHLSRLSASFSLSNNDDNNNHDASMSDDEKSTYSVPSLQHASSSLSAMQQEQRQRPWTTSVLAPPPLRVPSSATQRTHRSRASLGRDREWEVYEPDERDVEDAIRYQNSQDSEGHEGKEYAGEGHVWQSEEQSDDYPGRLGYGDRTVSRRGMRRTKSGALTYFADGIEDGGGEREARGSMARNAGRGF